jgi:hypothetical protein
VKYGLGLQVTADPQLTEYLNGVLAQVKRWLEKGEVKKLVLVIAHHETEEVLERSTTLAHTLPRPLTLPLIQAQPTPCTQPHSPRSSRAVIGGCST